MPLRTASCYIFLKHQGKSAGAARSVLATRELTESRVKMKQENIDETRQENKCDFSTSVSCVLHCNRMNTSDRNYYFLVI